MRISTIRAVNRLTTRWAAPATGAGERNTVFTAAGVWPLLALLADGAGGPARAEMEEALGLPAGEAAAAARQLLAGLAAIGGLDVATGLWTRRGLSLEPAWTTALPEGSHGELTGDPVPDQAALDTWAARHTRGLVERMPVTVDGDTLLVLASALALRLKWIRPFSDIPYTVHDGPWDGRPVVGLSRNTALPHRVRVARTAGGPVTVLEVVGDRGVDVHLVLGEPDAAPGDVLRGGIDTVTRAVASTDGTALPEGAPGPGLRVWTEPSPDRDPELRVQTVAFSVTGAHHNLLDHKEVFGLATATDDRSGHFPGISEEPLAVKAARQSAGATFTAEGFEAAAVTAFATAAGCGVMPRARYRARRLLARFDRPFGFLAVHRTSRLVLAAGWVAEPLPYEPGPDLYDPYDEDEDDEQDDEQDDE
ncbi:serpin family protein [Streptomyces antimicrobicus]|uniref:Serpin family protein n=1 Tax=Streptomyces antimicrobicus TaxID=2883108 RepID=A0ABS8BEM9_9ACTN|nr:serpin family protein [Streptomyces antimicrobicus]MCB5182978.1 serpin family protein [Streptomyces antimicrobicus]